MKHLLISLLIAFYSASACMAENTKPWTFWYWMYGAVSEEGIKADLQAMKDIGLGGCYLMPVRAAEERPEYNGQANAMSDNFWRLVDCSFQQADQLGLKMGIHLCDGFALAGGPWIKPEESMQMIVYTDTILRGGRHRFTMNKPQHHGDFYEDIGIYAIPEHDQNSDIFANRYGSLQMAFPIKGSDKATLSPELTINEKGVYCADKACWIQYAFDTPTLIYNLEIEPSGNNIQCQRLLVKASDDGANFRTVKQLTPPRQGWQNTGFNTTFSIPPTTAKYFRLEWTPEGTEPGSEDLDAAKWEPVLRFKNIKLGTMPTIDNWQGKAGYVWRTSPDTSAEDLPPKNYFYPSELMYGKMQGDVLDMELMGGTWRVLRIGYTSTGQVNATAGGGKGLECDKFSTQAVEKQVDEWFGRFMQRPHHEVVKYLHIDSWECGSQNWSKNFAAEFERRRGYDLLPVLPVMVGVPMVNAEQILRDVRLTINDLVNEHFFATVVRKAQGYGIQVSSESVAPTMISDGMQHYKYVDLPMGEFWYNSPTHDKPSDMLDAISAAHIYGKQIVQAEGFTTLRGTWDETPSMVKPLLDHNFCLGMNRLFFHVNTHNPWTDRKPGMTLDGIGLFFQRDQTWFAEAKGFVDYITRCQQLLQEGQPVVDIAVYTGEDVPCRALTPDRLVSMLPGVFGSERVAAEQARLANHGLPMTESPVGVKHAAGILDLKDWINPLHGYQYDSMNKDALFMQPFNYKVLVVPQGTYISQTVAQRLNMLAGQGVQLVLSPYGSSAFQSVRPDVVLPEGIAYAHRQTDDKDIYFLANQTDANQTFTPQFRASRAKAVIYNPLTDDYATLGSQITLRPYESVFVIMTQDANSPQNQAKFTYGKKEVYLKEKTADLRWDVVFKENGQSLTAQQPFDWSKQENDRIRYFSGHARYSTLLKLASKEVPKRRAWIALPNIKDVARVWINGKDCGIVWASPYEVEVTGALKKGKNTIEIEVVNTWHNALKGLDEGKAPYNGIWTNAKYRTSGKELLPAGLLAQPEFIREQQY